MIGAEIDSSFAPENGSKEILAAGMTWYRHVGNIDWASYNAGAHTFFADPAWGVEIDRGLAAASGAGLKLLLTVRNAPSWATISGIPGCGDIKPEMFHKLAQFIVAVIAKYSEAPYRINHYELWNEPDMQAPQDSEYVGCRSVENYVAALKYVYPVVKKLFPSVQVLAGAVVQTSTWFNTMIRTGAGFMDGVSFHSYETIEAGSQLWRWSGTSRPSEYQRRIDATKSMLAATGRSSTPIYITEGGAVEIGSIPYEEVQIRQSQFAAFLAASLPGEVAQHFIWFRMLPGFTSSLGEKRNYVYYPNQTYHALAFGIKLTAKARYVKTITGPNISEIQLTTPTGKLSLIWRHGQPQSITINDATRIYDVWGSEVAPGEIRLEGTLQVLWIRRDTTRIFLPIVE